MEFVLNEYHRGRRIEMNVLLINGSPYAHGCTHTALSVVADVLQQNGIETEIIHVGQKIFVDASDVENVVPLASVCLTARLCRLPKNKAFLIRAIARECEQGGLPETEPQPVATNFIR